MSKAGWSILCAIVLCAIPLVLLLGSVPERAFAQYPNVRLSSSWLTDPEEVSIAIDPTSPNRVAAGANLQYYYFSTDSGSTWTEQYLSSSLSIYGDPCLHFDATGTLYYTHLQRFPWLHNVVVQRSTDGGQSYEDGTEFGVRDSSEQDKAWIASDNSQSKYRGNLYEAWTRFDKYASTNSWDSSRLYFVRSSDKGLSWSIPLRLDATGGDCTDGDTTVEGAVPAVGPDGTVHVVWSCLQGLVYCKSTDGGQSFGANRVIGHQVSGWNFDVSGIYRCNGLPVTLCDQTKSKTRGNLYVIYGDRVPNSDGSGRDHADVYLLRSTNGGISWLPPIRVPQDTLRNTDLKQHDHFLPAASIDPVTGSLYIVYYDRRLHLGDTTDVFMAISRDGGATFEEHLVSEGAFAPEKKIFFGDYIGISAFGGMVRPIWMRMDNDSLSVWSALLKDTGAAMPIGVAGSRPAIGTVLSATTNGRSITLQLPTHGAVRLDVISLNGTTVRQLLRGDYYPGEYRLSWNGRDDRGGMVSNGGYVLSLSYRDEHGVERSITQKILQSE